MNINLTKHFILILTFFTYSFHVQAEPIDELNFIEGPKIVNILDRAKMNLGGDYLFLNVKDTAKFHLINQNIPGTSSR